ncbi:hypothetical protein CLV62_14313 [Dysgonomonas alginatilytica]|uniref:GTPase-associated system helical domain-containing protein n=1 Tax=Dysgonomonas alginatilytica TaxID=1605892 RepID=A0A2V3PKM1_9BACT|nr:GTPase-associated system all-helical protein GASH [Dysgonomonas alginatilytica]PXV58833.1 hypothetical protein CLV62_14313 [Dysgonomonas alginatilytica]
MKNKIARWYEASSIPMKSEEELNNRVDIIEKLSKDSSHEFDINCLKKYLGHNNDEFNKQLSSTILDISPVFPQLNNELELKIIASAILYDKACLAIDGDNYIIALACRLARFGKNNELLNADILEDIDNALDKYGDKIRELSNIKLDSSLDSVYKKKKDDAGALVFDSENSIKEVGKNLKILSTAISSLIKNNDILSEESNIHWWIFTAYSRKKNKPFTELSLPACVVLTALELYDVLSYVPQPSTSYAYLNKLLNEAHSKELKKKSTLTIVDVVKALEETNSWGDNLQDADPIICPLSYAYKLYLEHKGEEVWSTIFKIKTQLEPSTEFSTVDLSNQFLQEIIYLKHK